MALMGDSGFVTALMAIALRTVTVAHQAVTTRNIGSDHSSVRVGPVCKFPKRASGNLLLLWAVDRTGCERSTQTARKAFSESSYH
jgi:hypothetical protein